MIVITRVHDFQIMQRWSEEDKVVEVLQKFK